MHASAGLAHAPQSAPRSLASAPDGALRFDFVSALSAEASCPVCSELHATVDQCDCVACGTKTCPDCASLRPDARWICATCVVGSPALSVVPASAPLWQRARKVRLALVELALFVASGVGQAARPVLAQLSARLQVVYARLRTGAGLSARALERALRRQQRQQGARLRELVISVRNLQWRQHASSLLIATVILIAVARAQTSPDGR